MTVEQPQDNGDGRCAVCGKKLPHCWAKIRGKRPGKYGDGRCHMSLLCPNGRCSKHAGMTPAGMASPHWKNGLHSKYGKYLPRELNRVYREALADEELVSLRHELAVSEAFIKDRLGVLLTVEAPPWGEAVEALNDYKMAPVDGQVECFAVLENIIRTGASAAFKEREVREEVREMLQEKGKLAAAEWKRLNDIRAVVPVEQAVLFGQFVVGVVYELFGKDPRLSELQRRIAAEVPSGREALPGPEVDDD